MTPGPVTVPLGAVTRPVLFDALSYPAMQRESLADLRSSLA